MDKEAMRKVFEAEYARIHAMTPTRETAWLCWQAAIAHSGDALRNELHRDIMNLPCRVAFPHMEEPDEARAYKVGHRDARHAAAELALSALSRQGEGA
jgi:hypothetical protein